MQLGLLPAEESPKKVKCKKKDWFVPWETMLQKRTQGTGQADFLSENNSNDVITYHSGASNKSDFIGYMSANTPIGACAIDTSGPVRKMMADYADNGGLIFFDSGAFRNFMACEKNPEAKPLNYHEILKIYQDVLSRTKNTSNIMVVAPDAVGKQSESFEMLTNFKNEMKALHKQGAKVMVPLQKGDVPLGEFYYKCKALLEFDFVVGLPSNAKALSTQEVMAFVNETKPSEIHFLGCSERDFIHMAMHASPLTKFSCDATKLRKEIGQKNLLTVMHQQIKGEVVIEALHGNSQSYIGTGAEFDETEFIGNLTDIILHMSANELQNFCKATNCTEMELRQAAADDCTWDFLNEMNHGYAEQIVLQYHFDQCYNEISPRVRAAVVQQLAEANII